MARNRSEQDREAKRAAIVDAATTLFLGQGYEATTMAELARAAGVTPNTVYWYFDDKDAVFVEVVTGVFSRSWDDFRDDRPATLTDQLLWFVDLFDRLSGLVITIHARAEASAAVGAWHEEFHRTADAWLLRQAQAHLAARPGGAPSPDELAAVPRIWSYAIEGMVAHGAPAAERRQLCETLVRQLDRV